MRTIRTLSATLLLLVACSCQDISILQNLIPGLGDVDQGDGQGDGADIEVTQPPLPPQVDLAYGEDITESLDSVRGDLWTFLAEAGDAVTITMTSGEFDTFLALFGPQGNYVTCDDDSGVDYNASIIDFALPAAGIYTINAMGLDPGDTGAYSLSISQTANGLVRPQPGGGSLDIGDTKSGSLASWTGDAWIFNGDAGDIVSVGARSDAFDTVLAIYGPDLHREAWGDDSLGGHNALISGLTLPSSGRYTIVVRSFRDGEIGAYELGTAAGSGIPGWQASLPGGSADISYGEAGQGNLPGIQGDLWIFDGSAGDPVTISLTSNEFDPFLALFGPGGEYITCDDDGGDGLNALIDGYVLPASGTYSIGILSYGSAATGQYSLALDSTSPGAVTISINSVVISYGASINPTLGTWVGDVWSFQGGAGDAITISMTSTDFDATLDLYGPDLKRVASDDDSGGDMNALISATLPVAGWYTIVARSFSSGGAGSYTLSLSN